MLLWNWSSFFARAAVGGRTAMILRGSTHLSSSEEDVSVGLRTLIEAIEKHATRRRKENMLVKCAFFKFRRP